MGDYAFEPLLRFAAFVAAASTARLRSAFAASSSRTPTTRGVYEARRPSRSATAAPTNPSKSGFGRKWSAGEFWVELAGHKPRVVGELDDLNEAAVG